MVNDISQFSVCLEPAPSEQAKQELGDVILLLLHLRNLMPLSNVEFGQNPPDFIFHVENEKIGIELTDLDPKVFTKKGHKKRADFKSFEGETSKKQNDENVFDWSEYSSHDSLDAFASRLKEKQEKAKPWQSRFSQRWLLMHIANGSPFGEIITLEDKLQIETGFESFRSHKAKVSFCINQICQTISPFDCVILFSRENFVAFPSNISNRFNFPILPAEILELGITIPDAILDQKRGSRTIIKHRKINFPQP